MADRAAESRFVHIDALRAVAALLVVWTHTSEAFAVIAGSAFWVHDVAAAVDFGRIGVVVFFLISGFVVPSSLDRPGARGALVRGFLIKRFFRLYPIYWLSIPLGVLTFYVMWDKSLDGWAIAANFTMIQELLGFPSAEGLYWTLQTELIFYLVCVLLCLRGGIGSPVVLAATAAALFVVFFIGQTGARGLLLTATPAGQMLHLLAAHLSLMFTGTLLRQWHDGRLQSRPIRVVVGLLLGYWLLAPLYPLAQTLWFGRRGRSMVFEFSYALGVATFLVGAFVLPIRARAVVAIGRASYSLYLFHPVVFWPVLWLATRPGFEVLHGYPLYVYVAAMAGLSIVVALALYRWVELPMMALGSRLARGRRREPVVGAA